MTVRFLKMFTLVLLLLLSNDLFHDLMWHACVRVCEGV